MTRKLETAITQEIIDIIKSFGGDAYHVHGGSVQRSGEPDITGEFQAYLDDPHNIPWIHCKIEVKTPNGKPSKLQMYRLNRYVHSGYMAGIVTNASDFYFLLREYLLGGSNVASWEITCAENNYEPMEAPTADGRLRAIKTG